jgi:hypothetical protein
MARSPLTRKEEFAARAMAAFIEARARDWECAGSPNWDWSHLPYERLAHCSFNVAEAMEQEAEQRS